MSRSSTSGGQGMALYMPMVNPRQTIVYRTSYSDLHTGRQSGEFRQSSTRGSSSLIPVEAYGQLADQNVSRFRQEIDGDVTRLQETNEKLARYIEKVHQLQAENRQQAEEIRRLRARDRPLDRSAIEEAFAERKSQLQKDLEKLRAENGEIKVDELAVRDEYNSLKGENELINDQNEKLNKIIASLNDEIARLKKDKEIMKARVDGNDAERQRDKDLVTRLQEELQAARQDLSKETLAHLDAEHQKFTLEEQLEFLKHIYELELKDLRDREGGEAAAAVKEQYNNEMQQVLAEIRTQYDDRVGAVRSELNSQYELKMQQVVNNTSKDDLELDRKKDEVEKLRTQLTTLRDRFSGQNMEVGPLRDQLARLRAQYDEEKKECAAEKAKMRAEIENWKMTMEKIAEELQSVIVSKTSMEQEIEIYRQLLEGGDNSLRKILDAMQVKEDSSERYRIRQIEETRGDFNRIEQSVTDEIEAKFTVKRHATGPISIRESSESGEFITLENNGSKEEVLTGYSIKRIVDGQEIQSYDFPTFTKLRAGRKLTLWAKGSKPSNAPATDITATGVDAWEIGEKTVTRLVDGTGKAKATMTQTTTMA